MTSACIDFLIWRLLIHYVCPARAIRTTATESNNFFFLWKLMNNEAVAMQILMINNLLCLFHLVEMLSVPDRTGARRSASFSLQNICRSSKFLRIAFLHKPWLVLEWVHTCNVTAYRNSISWQRGRDSWPRNVSEVGYAVMLRAFSVWCRYLTVASKGWYGYGLSTCGRATSRCTSASAPAVTVSSLWCDCQIPIAHRTSP
jgi:hypothetical protein